ncbi:MULTISPECIES: DUF3105 domain-containing protein [Streptomyces]|uniref:DUF3105 domain-containing protein n=1 Tax=Streptomyces TaxID=1883 RepID=UPI0023F7D86B|nr:DUF3105 domain-containing protein [Streptomyces sp. Z423-1]
MNPVTRQSWTITLSAWDHPLSVDTASDPRVEQFITAYVQRSRHGQFKRYVAMPIPGSGPRSRSYVD